MATTPPEGRCQHCLQIRPLFPYKPEHDCIDIAGRVNLIEAAEWIDEMEMQGDRWRLARVERRRQMLCARCYDKEHAEEAAHIKEYGL